MNQNKQILTGQIKPSSLNVIYNRVGLMKSKNINRKLISKQQKSLHQQNYQLNNHQISLFNHNNIQMENNDNNFYQQGDSRVNQIKYNKKNRKLIQIKETDHSQTNFWNSQKNIQNIPLIQQTQSNSFNLQLNNHNIQSKGPQKINKFTRNRSNSTNNRVFLMSGHQRFPKFASQTINATQNTNQLNSLQNIQSIVSTKKRPLTSSINRGNTVFRVNQFSKQKQIRTKLSSKLQIPSQTNNSSQKNLSQSKLSQSRTSLKLVKGQDRHLVYKKQMNKFQQLYQYLSEVLGSIKQGLFEVQKAISLYANFIQNKNISFIDDFMVNRQIRLQKLVRSSRLHQTLSICYLFLQIAQNRIDDNESYLINFIGHSLSNLLLIVRLYIIKEGKQQFQISQFQKAIDQLQMTTYGQRLYSIDDILLRIQHNNEIITMIHKRLGRSNQKFQTCIRNFLKDAQRKKYSCSLCAHYIFEYLSMHIHQLDLLNISPSLQIAPQPYTPPEQKQYTLVIEPLGILQKNGKYRPYLNQFIKWANKNFDIILWTWQMPYAVQDIYDFLSPFLTSRLYRHHCIVQNNIFVKDLSRLGRNLQYTLIMDYDKRIYGKNYNNGIECRWKGNQNDKNLLILSQILQQMINSKTNVKDTLTFYAEEIYSIRGY